MHFRRFFPVLFLAASVFVGCASTPAPTIPGVTAEAARDYERAIARYRDGDYAAALAQFDKVTTSGPYPENRGVWLHAYAALAAGEADRAVELGDALLGAASSRAESYEFAAIARLFRGDPVGALAALKRASELEGKSPREWTYRGLAYEMLGQVEERRLACEKGDRDFEAALGNRPEDVVLHLERASLLAFCGSSDQLARTLASARDLLPKMDEETALVSPKRIERFTLPVLEGVSAAAKGDAAQAMTRVEDALGRAGDVPRFDRAEAYYFAFKVAQIAGRKDEAAKWEAEGKSLDPKGPYFGTFAKVAVPAEKKAASPPAKAPRKPSSIDEDEDRGPYEPAAEREDG